MGQPFRDRPRRQRDEVIRKYREWIQTQPDLLADVQTLRGKTLACWCRPQACHGDVLAELADTQKQMK